LDGQLTPESDYEPSSVVINYERRTTQTELEGGELGAAAGFVGNIEFYGGTAQALRNRLLPDTNPNFRTEAVKVRIENTCCPGQVVFNGEITFNGVEWCDSPECKFSAPVRDTNPDALAFSCIKSVLAKGGPDDDSFFRNNLHPFVRHVTLTGITPFLIILTVLYSTTLYTIIPLVAIVSIIVSAITLLLPGVPTIPPFVNQYIALVDRLGDLAIGAGRGHPAPLVVDYLDNICNQCGLTWQSLAFDRTAPAGTNYNNALYFNAPYSKGWRDYVVNGLPDPVVASEYYRFDAPNDTGAQFVDRLCRHLNLNWWIKDNILYIDAPPAPLPATLNLLTIPQADIISQCYAFYDGRRPLVYDFLHQQDFADTAGNQAKPYFDLLINAVQPPPPPGFEGKQDFNLPFGAAQFVNDNTGGDGLRPYASLPYVANNIGNADGYLCLSGDTASAPKLLLWDFRDRNFAKFERRALGNGLYSYNDRLKFTPGDQTAVFEQFWRRIFVDNNPLKGVEATIEIKLRCEYLNDLAVNGNLILQNGNTGVVQSYSVGADTITIKARY
jgi:hypothetical protein